MAIWPAVRTALMGERLVPRTALILTWVNGTTALGLVLSGAARTSLRRTPGGVLVAAGYRWRVPRQECFTLGCVIFTRQEADWLLDAGRRELLGHETRHVGQYAILGPLFLPAYAVASAWSWLVAGEYGCRNVFERHAGLAAGGYDDLPLRPWVTRIRHATRLRRHAAL
jgi:hypothetical protein